MTYEIDIGGRVTTVTVQRQDGRLHVTSGGRTHVVEARRVDAGRLSMLIGGVGGAPTRSVDAGVATRPMAGALDVHVEGRTVCVQVRQAGAPGRRRAAGPAHGSGPQRVLAPMPGKVVRVLVKPGDTVQARQGLVVVEAMKMENELRAAREGRVREVAAVEGQSVEAGATLIVVDEG